MHSTSLISPSFTTLSSNNLADVAARVVQEFRHQNEGDYDDIINFNDYDYHNSQLSVSADEKTHTITQPEKIEHENDCNHHEDEDEFEFATDLNNSSSIDSISLPQYPLFDRSLLLDVDPNLNGNHTAEECKTVRRPLRKLFSEDRDFGSSSSSEADDLDGIAPETYCVWKPNAQRCRKSNSTGNSSRRWRRFRDILYRSNSDVKESKSESESPFLFFKPLIPTNRKVNDEKVKVAGSVGDGTEKKDPASKAENGGDRRRS